MLNQAILLLYPLGRFTEATADHAGIEIGPGQVSQAGYRCLLQPNQVGFCDGNLLPPTTHASNAHTVVVHGIHLVTGKANHYHHTCPQTADINTVEVCLDNLFAIFMSVKKYIGFQEYLLVEKTLNPNVACNI